MVGIDDAGQATIDSLRASATALALSRGLPPKGVDSLLGPASHHLAEAHPRRSRPSTDRLATSDQLGMGYEAMRHELAEGRLDTTGSERKSAGRYFSPPALVEPTVQRTLAALDVRRTGFAVCDPACGGGAFLLACVRELTRRLQDELGIPDLEARRAALDRTFGVDIDSAAVRIARLALWIETADPDLDPEAMSHHVRVGDACVGAGWSVASHARTAADAACHQSMPSRSADSFFHWPLEFPELFRGPDATEGDGVFDGGFDAVVGNPPWDIHKPDSRQFFAAVDPAYPTYTKQVGLAVQDRLLRDDPALAARWSKVLTDHEEFRAWLRSEHAPFRRQGRGDGNRYKLFTELAWRLTRTGGRIGLIVPSSLYTDAGSADLRRLLLEDSRWEWLFGFENRARIFDIDNRFKFAVVIAQRGCGPTRRLRTAFLRTDVEDWREPEGTVAMTPESIRVVSPTSLAIPELRHTRDADTLHLLLQQSHPFGKELSETGIRYRRELDLTQDSKRFLPRDQAEADGFVRRSRGEWQRERDDGSTELALPLYEGRMIDAFDDSARGWVRGRGRRATWRDLRGETPTSKAIEPQFLLPVADLAHADPTPEIPKIGFMAIASATNQRSMVATMLRGVPCGNSVPTLRGTCPVDDLRILAILNSLVFDWALRLRLGGINLNRFVLAEAPMLTPERRKTWFGADATDVAASLLGPAIGSHSDLPPCVEPADRRLRRAALDAVAAHAFGIDETAFAWILRDCEHDSQDLSCRTFIKRLDPKGFWRIDADLPHEARLPGLAQHAFRQLRHHLDQAPSATAAVAAYCRHVLSTTSGTKVSTQPARPTP